MSRATAYRYFPTRAAMIQAAVDEALGPILAWTSEFGRRRGEGHRSSSAFAYPRMEKYEATPPRRAVAGARPMGAPPGRHARRRGRASCAGTAGRCSPRCSAAPRRLGRQAFDKADAIAVTDLRDRGYRRPQGHLGPRRRRGAAGGDLGRSRPGARGDRRGLGVIAHDPPRRTKKGNAAKKTGPTEEISHHLSRPGRLATASVSVSCEREKEMQVEP